MPAPRRGRSRRSASQSAEVPAAPKPEPEPKPEPAKKTVETTCTVPSYWDQEYAFEQAHNRIGYRKYVSRKYVPPRKPGEDAYVVFEEEV